MHDLQQINERCATLIEKHEEHGLPFPHLQEHDRMSTDCLEQKGCALEEAQLELQQIEGMLEATQKESQIEQQHLVDLEGDREAARLQLCDGQTMVTDHQAEVSQEQEYVRRLELCVCEQKRLLDGAKQGKQGQTDRCRKLQCDPDNLITSDHLPSVVSD
jgi:hypothetical protein